MLILSFGVAKSKDFPLRISEIQAENSLVDYTGQKLILVDFWATWCIPCRAATTQLEILQEQFKEEIFIISVTDETHEIVQKHINKHPSQLLVARDAQGNLTRKFGIYNRPYSILFNSDGDIMWEGHPAELTNNKIKRFHRKLLRSKNKQTLQEILFVDDVQEEPEQNREEEISISVEKIADTNTVFVKDAQIVNYYGAISTLIAQLKYVPKRFIEMKNTQDFFVHLQCPTTIWDNNSDVLLRLLNAEFGISIIKKPTIKEVVVLKVVAPEKLWDANQIDWGEDNTYKHLMGEERIQADNFTIADFCILLSNIKEKTYQYLGEDNETYDWDLHFLFDNLMETELSEEFGIELEEKKIEVVCFTVE